MKLPNLVEQTMGYVKSISRCSDQQEMVTLHCTTFTMRHQPDLLHEYQ